MAYFASVNGLQIVGGSLLIPLVGAWTADLHLATQQAVSGQATVAIGNLTLIGNVFRSETYGGQVRARIVGGYGGWRTPIKSQGYGNDAGVKLSTVLGDAAAACGEKVNVVVDTTIGNAYVRVAFPTSVAGDILWQMIAQKIIPAWRVDVAGVTQVTSWPSTTIASAFTVTDQKPDAGMVEIATEDYASWMPGCSFAAPQLAQSYTSAGVHYVWSDDGKFRFEVLTDTGDGDRVLGPVQKVIQKEIAGARFYGRYKYTIHNPTTSTIDGAPVDPSIGLPDVQKVAIRSDSISTYTPPDGGEAHIMFLDGVPTAPICVWTSGPPTHASLLNGTNPAAKLGDTVQSVVSGTLTILPGSSLAGNVPGPVTGVLIVQGTTPISGIITTGSSQLDAPL